MMLPTIQNEFSLQLLPFNHEVVNGVDFYVLEDTETDLVKVEIQLESGVKYQNKPFVARLLSDLLLEGTQKYPGERLKHTIDNLGAYIDVSVNRDDLIIEAVFLSRFHDQIVDILNQIIYHPKFTKENLKRVAGQLHNEIKLSNTKSSSMAFKLLTKELFAGHTYALFSDDKGIKTVDLNDLNSFLPVVQNGIRKIFVSGAVYPNFVVELKSLVQKRTQNNVSVTALKSHVACTVTKNTGKFDQDTMRIGQVLQNLDHPDLVTLKLANLIFGGYFGSRLMQIIREDKGWTYGIHSSIVNMQEASYFIISSDLKKGVFTDCVEVIEAQMLDLQNNLVSEEELDQAKRYLMGSMLQSLDGIFDQMNALKFSVFTGVNHQDYYENMHHVVANITPQDISAVCKKYFAVNKWVKVLVN